MSSEASAAAAAPPEPKIGIDTKERVIYDRLMRAKDGECAIRVLYAAAYDVAYTDLPTPRAQMQKLGSFVKRLNEKLAPHGKRIRPGEARGTYRLEDVPTAAG